MKRYILALDEGTTSTRSILFDRNGKIVAKAQKELTQFYPVSGWVEEDAVEIYAAQYATMTEAVVASGISPDEIAAIGITNQRETTVVWNKMTGRPICPAIVWQCRRTADICEKLRKDGLADTIKAATGLPIDAYFSGTKIKWILDHIEGAREAAERGELLFGTIDTWLIWKLTGGRVHATDLTNASRTMLFNIHTLEWDERLLSVLGNPAFHASGGADKRRQLRQYDASRCGNPDLRGRRRSAGGAVRSGLLPCGRREKYIRHRMFSAYEHRHVPL